MMTNEYDGDGYDEAQRSVMEDHLFEFVSKKNERRMVMEGGNYRVDDCASSA